MARINRQLPRAGDSVHDVMERYSDMVYRLAYARTGSRADADDVYQDVFLKYFSKNPTIESEEHLKAWLIRATVHTSINLLKSAWKRHFVPAYDVFEASTSANDALNTYDELRAALGRLPEKYRVVIYLFYYEDIPTEEIATILGEKPTTIRSRLKRGRERLKCLMEESEVDHV